MQSCSPNSGEHANAVRFQNVSAFRERMVPDQIVDHVVTLIGLSKIFFCVIDNAIGADRFHKIDITRAADSSDLGAERFRDLDGERADAARRAVDQDLLSGLNSSLVA